MGGGLPPSAPPPAPMADHDDPLPFAEDDSRNAPATGALDRLVRRFSRPAYGVVVAGLYALAYTALGLGLAPALLLFDAVRAWAAGLTGAAHWVVLGTAAAAAFFVFGFTLLVVIPLYNLLLPTRVRPFRGGYYTLQAAPWMLHNALFYVVRFTFLPFVTLTPPGIWFLRSMGMRIGRHAFVNTEYISDPQLITLGDDVAIGGSARIFAHYGGGGHLTVAPVVIEDRATIGLAATVMGDVVVGAGATVLAHSVLLPGSRVGAGETWAGVPARRVPRAEMERIKVAIRGSGEADA